MGGLAAGRPRLARRWAAVLALLSLAACGEPRQPNVLLISIDTLRADHLGCYGYERDTSPRIDALAREGVLFENALSSTSWTLPAHMTMLSGLPISVHGACEERHFDRQDDHGQRIPPPLRGELVSSALRAAGYRTAGFYSWKYLDDSFGFDSGFDVWQRCGIDLYSHPVLGVELARLRQTGEVEAMRELAFAFRELIDPRRPSSPEVVGEATRWLDAHTGDERPFFLFVHLFDVHDPYKPPKEFDRFGDPAYAGPIDVKHAQLISERVYPGMPPEDLARLISLYDGGIAYVDDQVGKLLDHLDALGLAEDTLVILTSDHGEEFFEHGTIGHRQHLYRESVAVPLVLRQPGRLPAGKRVAETVGLIDLAPTILAATGTPPPHELPGVDLGAVANAHSPGGERTYTSTLFVFGGRELAYREIGLARGSRHSVLTFCPDEFWSGEAYDWTVDRDELGAPLLFDSRSALGRDVREHLGRVVQAYRTLRERLPMRGAGLRALDDIEKKQLRALGYTGLSDPTAQVEEGDHTCVEGCIWGPRGAETLDSRP